MNWTSQASMHRFRMVFVLWSNLLLTLYFYLCIPIPSAILAFSIINTTIVTMACVGLKTKYAIFIIPNIVVKFILIIFLLFIGCVSLDSIHIKLRKEIDDEKMMEITEQKVISSDPFIRSFLPNQRDPFFVFWLMCFVLLLTAEVRMFFSECYKILFAHINEENNRSNSTSSTRKQAPPPSYAYCVEQKNELDGLPTYAQANKMKKQSKEVSPSEIPSTSRNIPMDQSIEERRKELDVFVSSL